MQEQTSQPQKYQSVNKYLYTFHITARTANDLYFEVPISTVWKECLEKLKAAQLAYPLDIHSFVLMNNHYHMLIYTPEANIDKFMHFFNKNLAQNIARHAGRINRIFAANYKWTVISSQDYYLNVVRYIYQNPIRANLVKKIEDYPYSDYLQKYHHHEFSFWINQNISDVELESTKKKLRRFVID
jgi:putative transposase